MMSIYRVQSATVPIAVLHKNRVRTLVNPKRAKYQTLADRMEEPLAVAGRDLFSTVLAINADYYGRNVAASRKELMMHAEEN